MTSPRVLSLPAYRFEQRRHAVAILTADYPDAAEDLAESLAPLDIPWSQVIEGGGPKAPMTRALEARLKERGWKKKVFSMSQTIDEKVIDSTTHEIDHFKGFDDGRPGIALEIEWNNKDPFFDRDLGTFARLHLLGVVSVGVIVTRGPSLQTALKQAFVDYYSGLSRADLEEVISGMRVDERHKVLSVLDRNERARIVANKKATSKYGEATTHWKKLMDRINRGLGNPCPLLLVGIEADRLHQ